MPNWEKSFVGSDRKSEQGKGQLCSPAPEIPPPPEVWDPGTPCVAITTCLVTSGDPGGKLWPIGVGTYDKRPRVTPATDVSRGHRTIVTKSGTNDAGGGVKPVADYLVHRLTLHWGSEVQVESHRCRSRSSTPVSDGLATVRRAEYSVSVCGKHGSLGIYGWCRVLLTRRKDRPGFSVSPFKIRGGCLSAAGAGFRQPLTYGDIIMG